MNGKQRVEKSEDGGEKNGENAIFKWTTHKKSKYVPFCVLRLTLEVRVPIEIEKTDKDNVRPKLRLVSSSNVSVF